MDLKTCRFCGMSNYEHRHPAAASAWVRYGTRANSHLQCAVAKKGEKFVRDLPTYKLAALPVLELKDLGMFGVLLDELRKRQVMFCPKCRQIISRSDIQTHGHGLEESIDAGL